MTTSKLQRRTGSLPASLAASALLALGAAALLPLTLPAQQKKEPTQRLVEGQVQDKGGKALPGAVVYIKDDKSLEVRSCLTDESGHFRFGQLSMANDYDLWANVDGKRSKARFISSFNSKPTLDYTLKVAAEVAAATAEAAPPTAPPPTTPQKAAEGTAAPLAAK